MARPSIRLTKLSVSGPNLPTFGKMHDPLFQHSIDGIKFGLRGWWGTTLESSMLCMHVTITPWTGMIIVPEDLQKTPWIEVEVDNGSILGVPFRTITMKGPSVVKLVLRLRSAGTPEAAWQMTKPFRDVLPRFKLGTVQDALNELKDGRNPRT